RTNQVGQGLAPTSNRITSTIAAMSAAGLVFASAGFGSVYAWSAGAPYGHLMAGLTVLMACGLECAKPLAVASALSAFRGFAVVRGGAVGLLRLRAVVPLLNA